MKNKIISCASTFLIFCLLVSLVCLTFVYMFSFKTNNELKFNADDMIALEQNFAAAGYIDSVGKENIMPSFVGVSLADGASRAGAYKGDAAESMYKDCFTVAKEFLAYGTMQTISEENARNLVRMAKNNGFLYIKYSAAYPKSIIVSLTDKNMFLQSISDEFIKEIFVFYNDYIEEVCTLALSQGEEHYLYTGPFGYRENFNKNIASEYNNIEGTFDFTFASEETDEIFVSKEKFESFILADTIIPKGNVTLPKVGFGKLGTKFSDARVYDKVLSVFTLNPEKVSVFTENDGTVIYYEEGQSVRISAGGEIKYSAMGNGIDIGSVIGYYVENYEYSLQDKIGATLLMAQGITKLAGISEKASVKLSGIAYDEQGNLTITYFFAYDGVDISHGERAFSFTISGNRIKEASCALFDIYDIDESDTLPSALLQVCAYVYGAKEKSDIMPCYSYEYEGSVAAQYHACVKSKEALR